MLNKNTDPLVSSDMLLGLDRTASDLEIPIEKELEQFGLGSVLEDNPEAFISMAVVADLLNHLTQKYKCPEFGLRVAEHRPKTRFGVLTLLLHTSPDVGTALHYGHKYIALASDSTMWNLTIRSDVARIIRSDRYQYGRNLTQIYLLGIAQYVELMIAFQGNKWRPSKVFFTHEEPEDPSYYSKVFGCPVIFRHNFNGFEFPAQNLHTPIPNSDPSLFNAILKHLESLELEKGYDDTTMKTRQFVRQHLGRRVCNLAGAATYLGLHPKALQRELRTNGFTFKQMLVETRHEVACYYLEYSRLPLKQLATMLGYSDISSFSRAFTRYRGKSPKQWRQTHR